MYHFGMGLLDWTILISFMLLLIVVLVICQRYVRSTADFLAANRCAGRYLLSITEGIAAIGAISIVARFEQQYVAGFASVWWGFLSGPTSLIISITGWVYYRFRETRCFTLAQFFEVRYSRNFRIFCGILGWISGILNYGIFPAVSAKFFIYYCRLPATFHIPGIPFAFSTYVCVMLIAIFLGCIFAIFGGQIAIMLTDFLQGIFCNVAFLLIVVFFLFKFNWGILSSTLLQQAELHPGQSLFNPFATTAIRDFNIWFFLILIGINFCAQGTWQGSSGYNAAAKNAHEAKMSRFLGTWRGLIQNILLIFIPICAFVFFHNPIFANHAAIVENAIQALPGQTATQARVPLFLAYILPTGLVGLFAAVMFAAMLSTDDTYMHSWGTIFIQDVLMPFRKKPLTPRQHLRWLRCAIVFVGLFAILFSYLFKQTEYILMFMQITGAIFMGGAGSVLIGGLYSKIGTTLGAWVAMSTGCVCSVSAIILQQCWPRVSCWLMEKLPVSCTPWLTAHQEKFPINGVVMAFYITILCFLLYFLCSFLDRKLHHQPIFNLEKMLHRGKYDTTGEHQQKCTDEIRPLWRKMGLTKEFSFFDRILFFASILWTILWFSVFLIGLGGHFSGLISNKGWLSFWHFYVLMSILLGTATTIWFLVCGCKDISSLFRALKSKEVNDADDGSVNNGKNAGEQ